MRAEASIGDDERQTSIVELFHLQVVEVGVEDREICPHTAIDPVGLGRPRNLGIIWKSAAARVPGLPCQPPPLKPRVALIYKSALSLARQSRLTLGVSSLHRSPVWMLQNSAPSGATQEMEFGHEVDVQMRCRLEGQRAAHRVGVQIVKCLTDQGVLGVPVVRSVVDSHAARARNASLSSFYCSHLVAADARAGEALTGFNPAR